MKTVAIITMACLIGSPLPAFAAGEPQPTRGYSGEAEFKTFCSSCHGLGAKGDGPVASALRRRPTDLTQLSKTHDGVFPEEMVSKTVDGRTPVNGHGGPDMPVWGDVFARSRESTNEESVKLRIDALVAYVKTLQEKDKP